MNYNELLSIIPETKYILVTPELAREILEHNTNNRNLNRNRVKLYSQEILNNQWDINPSPIIIKNNGEFLIDGQHRLEAIIEANTPVKLAFSKCSENAPTIDMGYLRDTSDYIKRFSNININKRIRYAVYMVRFKMMKGNFNKLISHVDIKNYISEHENDINNCFEFMFNGSGKTSKICKAPVMSAVYAAYLYGENINKLKTFCYVINSGMSTSKNEVSIIPCIKLIDSYYGSENKSRATLKSTTWEISGAVEEYIHRFCNGSESTRPIKKPTWYYTNELEKQKGTFSYGK